LLLRSLLVLLFALGAATTAAGEEYRLLNVDGRPVKWGAPALGAGAVVTYAFVSETTQFEDARNCRTMQPLDAVADSTGVARATVEDQAVAALALWQEAADITFERSDDPAAADILIGVDHATGRSAHADVLPSEDGGDVGVIRRGLVCLSSAQRWKIGFGEDSGAQDLRRTFAHEIGHALGLDHPGPHGAVMAFNYDEDSAGLQEGDVAGATALYGPVKAAGSPAIAALEAPRSGAASQGFH
jgi:hypothetical protein